MSTKPVSELFEVHLLRGYSDSTVDSKKRAMRYFIDSIGDLHIEDVTYGHAEDFQRVLRQGGRVAKTVNLYVTHLYCFCEWAVRRQYIKVNPFFGLQYLPEDHKKQPTFSDEELARILTVTDLNFKVLVCFGMMGLREGEALNLVVSDLDFEKGFILITSKKDTPQTWPWNIKNHKQAYAPFPEYVTLPDMSVNFHALVWELIESHPQQPYVCVKPDYYKKQIELKSRGAMHYRKKLCPWGNFDRDFKALLKRACVPAKSFHDLRRTFANKLRQSGYDLKEVQTLMRHKSIQTTALFYANVEEQELVAKVNRTLKHYQTNVP